MTSKDIQLVIFDCDGVLVDSEPLAVQVDAAMLADVGWDLTKSEIIHRFMGRSQEYMHKSIEEHTGRELPHDWEDRYTELMRKTFDAELMPVDGIHEALEGIDKQTCVASSGSHDKIRHSLGLTGLYAHFEGRIFSASEVSRGKPHPDLFLHAAKQMRVEPSTCVVIEDSQYGVEAAVAAGMRCLAYTGGFTPANRLAGLGGELFEDMREIPALIS